MNARYVCRYDTLYVDTMILPVEAVRCTGCRSGIAWRMFCEHEQRRNATAWAEQQFLLDEAATLVSTPYNEMS